jgi:hypothetical protein
MLNEDDSRMSIGLAMGEEILRALDSQGGIYTPKIRMQGNLTIDSEPDYGAKRGRTLGR